MYQSKNFIPGPTPPHLCPFCPEEFETLEEVRDHQRSLHGLTTEELKYKCPYSQCGNVSQAKGHNFETHIRTHTGEQPYACRVGGYPAMFADPSSRGRHEWKIHKLDSLTRMSFPKSPRDRKQGKKISLSKKTRKRPLKTPVKENRPLKKSISSDHHPHSLTPEQPLLLGPQPYTIRFGAKSLASPTSSGPSTPPAALTASLLTPPPPPPLRVHSLIQESNLAQGLTTPALQNYGVMAGSSFATAGQGYYWSPMFKSASPPITDVSNSCSVSRLESAIDPFTVMDSWHDPGLKYGMPPHHLSSMLDSDEPFEPLASSSWSPLSGYFQIPPFVPKFDLPGAGLQPAFDISMNFLSCPRDAINEAVMSAA